jgi:Bacterial protein of unknown function (DUF937)
MFSLFDMMRQAQGGAGLDNMARQFGVPPPQGQAAVAALLPALVMGLQRAAMDPATMREITGLLSRAPYAAFFQSAAQGFSPLARREGDQVLEQLFRSAEITRSVALQVAAFSGLGLELLRQMMPIIAAMFMGGLCVASDQGLSPWSAPNRQSRGALPSWSGAFLAAPWPWAEFLASLTPLAPAPAARATQPPPTPFEEMMALFLAGLRPTAPPAPPPQPRSAPNPAEAWSELMDTGREMQRQYLVLLRSLLDASWGRYPGRG